MVRSVPFSMRTMTTKLKALSFSLAIWYARPVVPCVTGRPSSLPACCDLMESTTPQSEQKDFFTGSRAPGRKLTGLPCCVVSPALRVNPSWDSLERTRSAPEVGRVGAPPNAEKGLRLDRAIDK